MPAANPKGRFAASPDTKGLQVAAKSGLRIQTQRPQTGMLRGRPYGKRSVSLSAEIAAEHRAELLPSANLALKMMGFTTTM